VESRLKIPRKLRKAKIAFEVQRAGNRGGQDDLLPRLSLRGMVEEISHTNEGHVWSVLGRFLLGRPCIACMPHWRV